MSLPLRFKLTKDVQAYSHHNGTHVIATGNSDRGSETCVRIWTASSSAGTQTSTFVFPSTSVRYIPYAHIALFVAVLGILCVYLTSMPLFAKYLADHVAIVRVHTSSLLNQTYHFLRLVWGVTTYLLRWTTAGIIGRVVNTITEMERVLGNAVREALMDA